MADRAYRRMQNDERRAQLLERATQLFGEHGYDALSMSQLAREAEISKALLYHYFPSKRRLFEAALEAGALELRERTQPDPDRPPAEQLAATLDAFLSWVQERPRAYAKLLESAGAREVRETMAQVRAETAGRILAGLGPAGGRPATRAAVFGWLAFLDGAILDWIEHGDMTREELHGMLLGSFAGALMAAGAGDALAA
ncbi:MAG TPA: TetR/AcrR family transcriptional regulator [Solirubrobacteraceae bacterium]|nr:TetR/AcrR family transcriptional regulator [Solirubrobacteraceae bacterium]